MNPKNKSIVSDVFFLILLSGFSLLMAGWLFNVKPTKLLMTPLNTYGDGQLLEFLLRINSDTSILPKDFLDNLNLAWPGSSRPELYPQSDDLIYFILSFLSSLFNLDIAYILTFLAIVKFPLTSVTTYFVARFILNRKLSAFLVSLIFPFVPYSLIRAEGHFMLGQVWLIPLALSFPLFLLFKRDFFKRTNLYKIYLVVLFSSIFSSFAGTYYFLFSILTLICANLLVLGKWYINLQNIKISAHPLTKKIINRNSAKELFFLFILPSFTYLICSLLIYQLINLDSLSAEKNINHLLLIRDSRVSVESLIYSGNFPTLFSDVYFFLDYYFGTNLQTIAAPFVSWEAGGIGPYFTLLIFVTFMLIAVPTFLNFERSKLNKTAPFFVLAIYLFFYFQGFGGTFFAEFVSPSVRAWGRISIFISFICLLLIISIAENNIINKNFNHKFKRIVWLTLFVTLFYSFLWNSAYFKSFNVSRLSNSQVLDVYDSEQKLLGNVFGSFSSLPSGCPIVVLPYYPFPEFDRPNDRLSDYDLLALPLFDKNNSFKWNVGAIKWSEDDRWWSSLASDIPGFASADALTQIAFASHYGACAIALNQGMFSSEEFELKPDYLTKYQCPLLGSFPNATPSNSWITWDIRSDKCRQSILINAQLAPNSFSTDADGPLLWRFSNISPEKYQSNYPIFSSKTPVNLDFMSMTNKQRTDEPKLTIKIIENNEEEKLNVNICVITQNNNTEKCELKKITQNEIQYNLKQYLDGKKHQIKITPQPTQNEIKWATLITY